jgi:nonribosomal peptide synthetase DhbF
MEETLGARLALVASRHSSRPALICGDRTYSYGELMAQASAVASGLDGMSVGAAAVVQVGRSGSSIVAILGALLSGRAYVPIDATYPEARLKQALAETSSSSYVKADEKVVDFRTVDPKIAPRSGSELLSGAAYVIYTSGTTGIPKGCILTHDNVSSLLAATDDIFGRGPGVISSIAHSLAFDFSVWELWLAFAGGGTAVLLDDGTMRSPRRLCDILSEKGVTHFSATPSLLSVIVDEFNARPYAFHNLQWVMLGGEGARLEDVRRLAGIRANGTRFANMYGITETTVHVTFKELLGTEESTLPGATPIGLPLRNAEMSIRDENGAPCGPGEPGEIWVSGAGVGRGYLGHDEIAGRKFILDDAGNRWYRSGDVGVFDGEQFHSIGRSDRQVQFKGYRIELQGIEAVIERQTCVKKAFVQVEKRPGTGLPMLTAYIQPEDGEVPDASLLKIEVRKVLPAHSLPSSWRLVTEFERTVNGKIDFARTVKASTPLPNGGTAKAAQVQPRTLS